MRVLMAVGLVWGMAGAAWAQDACVGRTWEEMSTCPAFQAQQRAFDRQAQVEAARQQALGLALFGSGPALIQGMNQGFQQMQVKPMPPMQIAPPVRYTK